MKRPLPELLVVAERRAYVRMNADVPEARSEAEAIRSCRAELGTIPPAMLALSHEQRHALVLPALRDAMAGYDGSRSALIAGETGIGKTMWAVDWLDQRLHAACSGTAPWFTFGFQSAIRLARARPQHPLGAGVPPSLEHAASCGLLVLDDLGWEPAEDRDVAAVLAARYERGAPTLITSGVEPKALVARYSEAVIRRVLEAGGKGKLVDLLRQKLRAVT